jgi:hypothetical protein
MPAAALCGAIGHEFLYRQACFLQAFLFYPGVWQTDPKRIVGFMFAQPKEVTKSK